VITACKTTASAVTQFFPTVMQTFGYSRVHTLLLTTPPYILATIVSLVLSRISDKNPFLRNAGPERSIHFSVTLLIGMAGFIIAATTTATGPRYFAMFLMLSGTHGCVIFVPLSSSSPFLLFSFSPFLLFSFSRFLTLLPSTVTSMSCWHGILVSSNVPVASVRWPWP
jgi:hypothetical protein